jgi:hypothetical protein
MVIVTKTGRRYIRKREMSAVKALLTERNKNNDSIPEVYEILRTLNLIHISSTGTVYTDNDNSNQLTNRLFAG